MAVRRPTPINAIWERILHLRTLAYGGKPWTWLFTGYNILSALTWCRDEFWRPSNPDKYRIINLIPHLSVEWWLLGLVLILFLGTVESSFRLNKRNLLSHGDIENFSVRSWDRVDPLSLFQIACLWEGIEPPPIFGKDFPGKANPRLQTLIHAVDRKLLARPAIDGVPDNTNAQPIAAVATALFYSKGATPTSQVKRNALRLYAEARDERPAFLFPEDEAAHWIPLREAARRAFEITEGTTYDEINFSMNKTEAQKLELAVGGLLTHKRLMRGKSPPSEIAREIPAQIMDHLAWTQFQDGLHSIFASQPARYIDVVVSKDALDEHLDYLRRLASITL